MTRWLAEAEAHPTPANWATRMAQMAEADTHIEWDKNMTDLATRSREILDEEYQAHLLKKQSPTDE